MASTSKPFTIKLSKRLSGIESLIAPDHQYAHIWDCCCDHGLLGTSLLAREVVPTIHFVDIVPELVENLRKKLMRFFVNSPNTWQTHCLDVGYLPLTEYQGKHLVIIAGVGGDLVTKMITEIKQNNPNLTIDFILCPVHHQFTLREKLIDLDFSCKNEVLIEDNKRFYEILFVSSKSNKEQKINAVGDKIWQPQIEEHQLIIEQYHKQTLNHYRRIANGLKGLQSDKGKQEQKIRINRIINAYENDVYEKIKLNKNKI